MSKVLKIEIDEDLAIQIIELLREIAKAAKEK